MVGQNHQEVEEQEEEQILQVEEEQILQVVEVLVVGRSHQVVEVLVAE